MDVTIGADCTGANVDQAPPHVQLAGYSTGTGDVPWTQAQFDAHPGTLRICQDPGATDDTADYLDIESGAATFADAPGWYTRATASFRAVKRPGQRTPAAYASASNITAVVDEMVAHGFKGGLGLVIANWNLTSAQAQAQLMADLAARPDPWPVVGIQFSNAGPFDWNVFSTRWLAATAQNNRKTFVTDGKTTIGQYAASRGMKPIPWCLLQQSLRPVNANELVGSAVPAAGHNWWTEH